MSLRSSDSSPELTPERFEQLLSFLLGLKNRLNLSEQERRQAGKKYEDVRHRLVMYFTCRGAAYLPGAESTPEELADETINRVARKMPELAPVYVGDPVRYFCGVARLVFKEAVRKRPEPKPLPSPEPGEEDELAHDCLEQCMSHLTSRNRNLVLDYYRGQGGAKIRARKELAAGLKIDLNALRIRVFRIRSNLKGCVLDCIRMNST